jgi:CheY-like chemotaxis protein
MQDAQHVLVLLVEDEPAVRIVACDGLEDAGFEVLEAASAAEALSVLRARRDVGVLFSDVNMPGDLDGLDLAEVVHQHWPAIKLVLTSGRALERKLPDDGRFIAKPYSLRRLAELIAELSRDDPAPH